jgi:hypothetical protein
MALEDINDAQAPQGEALYPVQFSVDYPESRNRLTALVRLILVIPILVVFGLLGGYVTDWSDTDDDMAQQGEGLADNEESATIGVFKDPWIAPFGVLAFPILLPVLLMVLFRQKYPRWWFDWNLELNRFEARISAYVMLLRDEYPSTDEHQAVSLEIEYPDVERQLNRFLPLIKWLLAIPHLIVLFFLWIAIVIVTIIAWLAILIAGRYPRGLFTFVVGTERWGWRVWAYAFMLTTDRYPPFRFSP